MASIRSSEKQRLIEALSEGVAIATLQEAQTVSRTEQAEAQTIKFQEYQGTQAQGEGRLF